MEDYPIPAGNYREIKDIVTTLNKLTIKDVWFSLDKDNLMNIQVKNSNIASLKMNKLLHYTLGYDADVITCTTKATHFPQLNRGRFAFFIYSNLVNHIRVGDMDAPLMDVISIPKSEYGDIISLDVINPLYSPVALKHINEVEIMLATDSGELITFDNRPGNAKTLIVLHFVQVI